MFALEIYGRARGVYRGAKLEEPTDYPVVNADAAKSGRAVVAFGDSLTQGVGAPEGLGYPGQLAQIIGREVINRGVRGETTRDGLARLERDILPLNPGIVLLCFGGNDLIRGRSIAETIGDIEELIGQLQRAGAMVVLLGLRGSWLYKLDLDAPTRSLARRTGCPCVPLLLDGVWGFPWLMADHAHPNQRGYKHIAVRVAKCLKPYL
ncbi:MAG: hypothetical protein K1X53_15745 [Candidatus Sumerlaeaceae bacterium]|nr:hypothetical protein [Candidatus Sumerlaeaceae bacterium]